MGNTTARQVGNVVLLNGPPSCGKTTLARALRDALDEPYFHRSLDDFRAGFAERYWRSDDGSLFERVLVGYLGALRSMAVAGINLIAEAVITPSRVGVYLTAFEDLPVTLVGVRCPLDVAVAREQQRRDRVRGPLDLPADAFEAVHSHGEYDIEVDTSVGVPESLATDLAGRLRGSAPVAFSRLRDRNSY